MATEHPSDVSEQVLLLAAQVFALVRACPEGKATTYSWIGKAVRHPRSARLVGWVMNEASRTLPAQRVINSKGELTGSWAFGKQGQMRQLLEHEGIAFSEDGRVDLKRYGWDPTRDLTPEALQSVLATADSSEVVVSDRFWYLVYNDPASPFRRLPASNSQE